MKCFFITIFCFMVSACLSTSEDGGQSKRSDDATLTSLQVLVTSQAQVIQQLQTKLTAMENHQHSTDQQIASLQARLAKQETEVGFSTHFDTHLNSVNVTGGHVIIFDSVDLNLGNGFNSATGVFSAPVSGLYFFSVHIGHTPPGRIKVHLVKNGAEISETESSGDDQYSDRSNNAVTVHLRAGDRVWPEKNSGTDSQIQGGFRSSFTGVLVTADHP